MFQSGFTIFRFFSFSTPEMNSAPKISVIWYPYRYIWQLTHDQLMQCWKVNKQLTFGYLSHLWTDFENLFFKMLPMTLGSKWRVQIWAGIIFSRFLFCHTAPLLELVDKLISYVVFDMIYFTWRRFVMIRAQFLDIFASLWLFSEFKSSENCQNASKIGYFFMLNVFWCPYNDNL